MRVHSGPPEAWFGSHLQSSGKAPSEQPTERSQLAPTGFAFLPSDLRCQATTASAGDTMLVFIPRERPELK
ncbi:hypothetical protein [Pseudomonas azerbaijanoccidentalis]